jgi:glycosyltransferase involved in cell wall biosynthesis
MTARSGAGGSRKRIASQLTQHPCRPRVSIITALQNKGRYVSDTIRAVQAQTMGDWELIVAENGSSDSGPIQVRQILDDRIKVVESERRGPGAGRNEALKHAAGDWVLFLDADDLIEPNHLSDLLNAAMRSPSASIVAGAWWQFQDGCPKAKTLHRPATFGFEHSKLLTRAVALAPWVLHAALVKRDALSKTAWPEHLDTYADEDTAFWFQILLRTEVAWSENSGALYRMGTPSNRSVSGSLVHRIEGYAKIVESNLEAALAADVRLGPEYCNHIMTMFEVSYRKAIEVRDEAAAQLALRHASSWLKRSSDDSWKISLRKALGLRLFNRIRRSVKALRPVCKR